MSEVESAAMELWWDIEESLEEIGAFEGIDVHFECDQAASIARRLLRDPGPKLKKKLEAAEAMARALRVRRAAGTIRHSELTTLLEWDQGELK